MAMPWPKLCVVGGKNVGWVGKFQRKSIEGIGRLGLEEAIGEEREKRSRREGFGRR